VFACQWANLDQISGGRMLLAACTGIVPELSAHEGAQWSVPDTERGPRLVENIKICRKLWSEEHVTYEGKFRSLNDVSLSPRPLQQPCPIWIASNPPPVNIKTMRRVARCADGWMSAQPYPGMFANNWEKLCEYLREEAKDPDSFPNIAYHNINIGPDRGASLDESKRFLDEYYGPVFNSKMVEAWTAAGTPAQCAENLRSMAAAGAKAITLRITGWHQREQYKRLTEEVLPLLR